MSTYSIVVTDEYLSTIEENWLSLEPADAYDFIPEDLTYEMYMSEDFQAKLAAAGSRLNDSIEGKDIALAGFMVQCIHVPPPPLNQTLLVDVTANPTKFRDMYMPIIVYGRISVGSQSFDIADSGYTINDAVVETLHFSDEEYANEDYSYNLEDPHD